MTLERKVGAILTRKKKTLSVAESCTGGLLGHRLTNVAGSSKYFSGGVVAYANETKINTLKVSPFFIKKHGAVSEPIAKQMALGIRKLLKTDYGVSITGIAGPTGGTQQRPVGLTYISVSSTKEIFCKEFHFKGSRLKIKTSATQAALKLLLEII